MTTDYLGATDEMNAAIGQVIQGAVKDLIGYAPAIYWQGIGDDSKLDQSKYSVVVRRNTLGSDQGTLSNCVGAVGGRRFNTWGFIVVQLYGPTIDSTSQTMLGKCGMALQKAMRRRVTTNVVRLSDVRMDDSIGVVNRFNRLNVVAAFEYDEVQ